MHQVLPQNITNPTYIKEGKEIMVTIIEGCNRSEIDDIVERDIMMHHLIDSFPKR